MTARRQLVILLLGAACAQPPRTDPAPRPALEPPTHVDTVARLPDREVLDTMVSYRIPGFREGALVTWAPQPPGTPHAERERTYDLQHQTVRVRFDWDRRAVVGSTTLRVAALAGTAPLSSVAIDAVGMTIVRVTGGGGRALRHDYDGRVLTVHLAAPIRAGARTTVTVDYETVRPPKGAYFIDRRRVVWTQGETEDTRYWVPTYDYPNDKTTWEFFVRTPANEKALSNGRLVASRRVGDEVEWHWRLEQPASTYLMSVVTGDYVVLQDTWRTVPIGYWVYPDSVQAAWRGFGKTPLMVELFTSRTRVEYPWVKYDQIVAPDFIFGGMENVTASTQADDRILHPSWAAPQALMSAEDLVAHELAHQWYGNLLTTRDWSNIWLNEGFARMFEAIWQEEHRGADEGAYKRLVAREQSIAADLAARRPLVYDRWVTDPLELFFSGHIYPKGAAVLQMLRRDLGDSLFWNGINRYTDGHRFGSVVSEDLQRAFERASGEDLSQFFRQWVYGAGFPAFRVAYAYDSLARRLSLQARQVQPRDSLTGWFHYDVEIEILTDSGPVWVMLPVRDSLARATVPMRYPPRSIRWDKGGWMLHVTDFPRPTVMLAYQLAHDDDIIGRIEAAELLADRGGEPMAVVALARAVRDDPFWGVRARTAGALGRLAAAPEATYALIDATRDPDARVRQAAAASLQGAPVELVVSHLRELMTSDSSLYVRRAAVRSLAVLEPEAALSEIRGMLERDSWLDMERSAAMEALALVQRPEAWDLAIRHLDKTTHRATRIAAIGTLTAGAAGREIEGTRALLPLLESDDMFIRITAAQAIARLGRAEAIPALERRLSTEAEGRVITQLEAALNALRGSR